MIFRILEEKYTEQSKQSKAVDRRFMELALSLGARGLGQTWPNPAVGAVIVKDGVIVGRGWTASGGRPHAETQALARAGAAARGATLYVTLEPCSHHGKTPPCADALIAAGVVRVVSAIEDPNPEVAGQGHARLRAAGIVVEVGLCAEEARRTHAGHIRRVTSGRPHVTLKLAVSADDRIGAAGRQPVAVTGEEVRSMVHLQRAQHDAILIGVGTALSDDPELTCRLPGMEKRSPVRVVLDRRLRLPASSKLVRTARATPVWLYAERAGEPSKTAVIEAAGVEIRAMPASAPQLDLHAILNDLARSGITRLMVEGGSRVAASFLAADLVDEAWLYRSKTTIGADGVPALEGMPLSHLTQSSAFRLRASEDVGDDHLAIYERS
jgi:diaminohydroxyphosphoribosylaminopyrimidine deaminase/5-amino-6-(5-phosphoribosylamino)uracil reductase